MSDIGRLFRLRATADVEPLEDFTSAARAIAIGTDPRPIRRALRNEEVQRCGEIAC